MAALHELNVLDTPPEELFDDIAALASEICGTPIGLVSLVDSDRQWFKARVGWDAEATGRHVSFCGQVVGDREFVEIDDAKADPRFAGNPLVVDEGMRFYAGAPLLLPDGEVVGTVCVLDRQPNRLSGSQRQALRALARHAVAQLELRRFAQRMDDTAQRLRELERMKDSFLSSVSHELRTPLASIRGYLEMLLDGDGNDPQTARRFLDVMQRNADRLLRLIDDLLLVAQLQDRGMRLRTADIDLSSLAYDAVVQSRPLADHKGVILVEPADAVTPVHGDGQRLSQAVHHLLFNAIKFTPAGGTVTVAVQDADWPTLTINDTGVGIAAADLPHLFDRFYRTSAADTLAAQGAGLGLTIVKAIVEAHHGTIAVAGQPDHGTSVTITLPRATHTGSGTRER